MTEPLQGVDPDEDATVFLPTPGRTRAQQAPAIERPAAAADLGKLGGLNALIEAANPLLAAVPQIRHALRHPDPAGLRARLREEIASFERNARAAGVAEDRVVVARYALCALLDDSAAATPWGREWATRGLVAEVQGEASGADKFFVLLEQMSADPDKYVELLEFFYVCLALGFEGKHRGGEAGRQALAQTRDKLNGLLAPRRSPIPMELSARWQGVALGAQRVPGGLALAAAASACLLVLGGLYLGYVLALGAQADPVARQLAQLNATPLAGQSIAAAPAAPSGPAATAPAAPKPAARADLSRDLQPEITRGEITVSQVAGGSLIVLKSDGLFGSGNARLNSAFHPVILRISGVLDRAPGTIVITGHTDDVPIRTARFPSNWELSTERARSVAELMAANLRDPKRLRVEGVADSQPVVPNDSAANRARNRRVAILLRGAS